MSEGQTSIAADALRLFIERIERLEEEKKGIADDIRNVYLEARASGYDVKTMRAIVRLRKMEPHQRREAEALLDTYKAALGMDGGTPDLFEGHDGRSPSDAVISYARHLAEQADDGKTDVIITSSDGVVAFESKAAKARKSRTAGTAAGAAH